jgi:hypothetical protein
MIINWNVDKVIADCQKMYHGANDPYETGWNNWPCKQDLYRVKFAVDEMLKKTANFVDEEQWVSEQQVEREKNQVWKTLNEMQKLR